MAREIDQTRCTGCGVCLEVCPNDGIELVDCDFVILKGLCTECYGFYSRAACAEVCPENAIREAKDPDNEAALAMRAAGLHPERFPRD